MLGDCGTRVKKPRYREAIRLQVFTEAYEATSMSTLKICMKILGLESHPNISFHVDDCLHGYTTVEVSVIVVLKRRGQLQLNPPCRHYRDQGENAWWW